MRKSLFKALCSVPIFVALYGCAGLESVETPSPTNPVTGVINTIIDLINQHEKVKLNPDDYQNTSLKEIITLGTPAGYRLKVRYLEFGISIVEALRISRDEELQKRLLEMVMWSRKPRVRADALITLAGYSNPDHKKYFVSALFDSDIGIRMAAIEALQLWGRPEGVELLQRAMQNDWSPLMRLLAAQALLSLGDKSGLEPLFKYLSSDSWVIKAMAARYLGDYASPDDYQKLIRELEKESKNTFLIAELSIASLKLISQKGDKVSYSPFAKGWRDNEQVSYVITKDNVVELEPMIIIPPRLYIPESLQIAAVINNKLLDLIKNRLEEQLDPIQAQDPMLRDLNALYTPSGFALKKRYAELSYLVVEGLAGTTDPFLRPELENMAKRDSRPLVRATALLSLAFNREQRDLGLILDALRDDSPVVRFSGMEAIEVGRFEGALPSLVPVAFSDSCQAFRVYAAQILAKFGDPTGRNTLLNNLINPDWPTRAMAYWYLGRYGSEEDYNIMLTRLPNESDPFVKSEIALGAVRLEPFRQ